MHQLQGQTQLHPWGSHCCCCCCCWLLAQVQVWGSQAQLQQTRYQRLQLKHPKAARLVRLHLLLPQLLLSWQEHHLLLQGGCWMLQQHLVAVRVCWCHPHLQLQELQACVVAALLLVLVLLLLLLCVHHQHAT